MSSIPSARPGLNYWLGQAEHVPGLSGSRNHRGAESAIMSKAIYQNLKALEPVKKVLADAASAIKDKSRSIRTSEIPEVIGVVVEAPPAWGSASRPSLRQE